MEKADRNIVLKVIEDSMISDGEEAFEEDI